MRQIPTPEWARPVDVSMEGLRLSEYQALQERRSLLDQAVHAEIESYVNDPELCSDSVDEFPQFQKLTGEYYIGSESYERQVGPLEYRVAVLCRCLERSTGLPETSSDYLGLEVWLSCDPSTWTFTVFRNTDSSSI